MTYTAVGLFSSQNQSDKISESLKQKGFKDSDFIIYLTKHRDTEKKPFWKNLFSKDDHEASTIDSLTVSVAINNDTELELAKTAFSENNVIYTYVLNEVAFEEARDIEHIKKIVNIKAKMQIYTMPEIKTSHIEIHTGINSEVK